MTASRSRRSVSGEVSATSRVDILLPGPIFIPAGTPITTGLVLQLLGQDPASIRNNAFVYAGVMTVPYYLTAAANPNDATLLSEEWEGNPFTLDPSATPTTHLTRFNPVPVVRSTETIPPRRTGPSRLTAPLPHAQHEGQERR